MRDGDLKKREAGYKKLHLEWKASGKSGVAFCRETGISYWTLRTAIKKAKGLPEKLRRRAAPSQFKEIQLPLSVGGISGYNVTLRNGRELSIPEQFSEDHVRILLGLLESC